MTFKEAMVAPLKKYLTFSGRASRKEYWSFYLLTLVLLILTLGLASFVLFIPAITVMTRRLHDTGHSGWMQLIMLIPFGSLYLLYLTCKSGDKGENSYGSDPWAVTEPVGRIALPSTAAA